MIVDHFRRLHYFEPAHKESPPSGGLPSAAEEENESEDLLVEKLTEVAGAYSHKLVSTPFDWIPNEILSLIFEHGYFGSRTGPPDKSFRELVGDISRRFREVALQTLSLWASVHLSPSNVFDEIDLLPTYLKRSKHYPLDMHFSCFWAPELTEQIMDIMTPHSVRWNRLSMTVKDDHALTLLKHVAVPGLNVLSITFYSNQRRIALSSPTFKNDLPQLQRLCLRNVDLNNIDFSLRNIKTLEIRGYGIWPNFNRLNDMVGQSTNLQRLILHVKPAQVLAQLRMSLPGGSSSALGQIYLPALEYLMVYTSEWLTQDVTDFIKFFNSPKLKVLALQESVCSQTEKANPIMTYLVRLKRLDPVTLEPVWIEAWEDYGEGRQAHSDDLAVQPTLWVKSASLYHAYNAVACSIASQLTALELNGVFFPQLTQVKEIFTSLKNLQHLSMFNFVPNEALLSIGDGAGWDKMGVIDIPSLLTLVIVFRPSSRSTSADSFGQFLQLFNLPLLSFLLLKHLTFSCWRGVIEVFRQRGVQSYPKLTSLKLIDVEEGLPVESFTAHHANLVAAFPRLERLLLNGVSSTCFLQCLLAECYSDFANEDAVPVWPSLTSLAIVNDPCAIRPLLHRVIYARAAFGRPLKSLYLDTAFTMNAESIEWMKERVSVVEIFPPRVPTFR